MLRLKHLSPKAYAEGDCDKEPTFTLDDAIDNMELMIF